VEKVAVKTGSVNTDFVEITEGLTTEDTVVISGQINLKDGTEVNILNK
jgi:multidrug efflux pump subunit AcrA (membrane-fusion protein)